MISGIQNASMSSVQLTNQSQSASSESVTQNQGDDFQQKARSKGIPDSVIKQGKQAAMKWLTENKQTADTAKSSSTQMVSGSQMETKDMPEALLDTFA